MPRLRRAFEHRPQGVLKWTLHAPVPVFRARLGFVFGKRFLLLEHVGRRSGKVRFTPLEVVAREGREYFVVSARGWKADWVRNVEAAPPPAVWIGSTRHADPVCRFVGLDERTGRMEAYERDHPRAAAAISGLIGLSHDGTTEGRRAVMEQLPMLGFRI